ncbi:MAG TPA: LptF/LptG family permease [Candidatus Avidesulfovibrio excrementigallinarum]|nr:LptF/LptG family permease [Candidatus Avidesulfovibrio excrementigallinarum]
MSLRPSLLFRYLFRANIMLMMITLAVGIGLYLLTDLFERLDNFMGAGLTAKMVAIYFLYKIPLVVSQILPVIFLLAVVIQLCIMARSRELVALQAGGISMGTIAALLILCGMIWSAVELGFSEVLGVMGERESKRIWVEEVRKRDLASAVFTDVWFSDGQWIVTLKTLRPGNDGEGFAGFELTGDGLSMKRMIRAERFAGRAGSWTLNNVTEYVPDEYVTRTLPSMELPLRQDPTTFRMFSNDSTPQQLPIWQLGEAIDRLSSSGSNVEALRTAWHMKLAYAVSIVAMAMIGVALVSWNSNIYMATALALVCTFLYYAVFTMGSALGQRGILPPAVAAWGANALAVTLAGLRLAPLLFHKKL